LRPIDEDDPSDNFFDVALDTARVPEDPVSTFAEGRSKSYMVNLAENEGFFNNLLEFFSKIFFKDSKERNQQRNHSFSQTAASFGQSLCLTVGEHTRWLGVPRRDSQESAAYGCETLGEKEVKNETTDTTMVFFLFISLVQTSLSHNYESKKLVFLNFIHVFIEYKLSYM